MRDYIFSSLIAVLACLFCIWLLRPLAVRIGLVDRPNERKQHENEIPLIGGIAIFFGFCFALLHLNISMQPYRSLLAGSALLILIGIVDDFHDLSARLRLLGQVMVALILTSWGGVLINQLGDILFMGNIALNLWALPLTVLLVVAYLNAMNMMDGQDGLAGSVALGQALWLFLLAYQLQLTAINHLLIIFIMPLLVFLTFNMSLPWRKQASIFLGDSGSTFLAFVLIWIAIHISQSDINLVHPVEILWIIALPLFDLLSVIVHRLRQNKSIFQAGRDHVHHVLHQLGINKVLSTVLLSVLSFGLGAVGYLLNLFQVAETISFAAYLSTLVLYVFLIESCRDRKPLKAALATDEREQHAG